MKFMGRVLMATLAAIALVFVGTGSSQAAMDNQMSLVDGGAGP